MRSNFAQGEKLGDSIRDMKLRSNTISSAVTAIVFAVAGAIPVFVAMANEAGLSTKEAASIVVWGLGIGGIISIYLSLRFKQPIYTAPSITAVGIIVPMFQQFSVSEMVFGYMVAGVIVFSLGFTGIVGTIGKYLPMPIVLGMVAGVFMSYALNLILAVKALPIAGFAILAAFFLSPLIHKKIPPQAAALIVAMIAANIILSENNSVESTVYQLTAPVFLLPSFNLAVIPLVSLPLVIMAIADIFKGYGILQANGYKTCLNSITALCGLASVFSAFGLGHTIATAGPAIAIVAGNNAGEKENRYTCAVMFIIPTIAVSLFACVVAVFLNKLPTPIIQIICGLAMMGLLVSSLEAAFGKKKFQTGALVAFAVGLSHITIAGLGAPIWAVLFGILASLTMERSHFSA